MSDKKQPDQNKPEQTSTDNSKVETPAGLSASINISASQEPSVSKPASAGNTKKPSEPIKEKATENMNQPTRSSQKNHNQGAAPVKSVTDNTAKNSTTNKTPVDKSTTTQAKKNKISKIAVVALIIALIAIAASVGHYYWVEQQKAQYSQQLNKILDGKIAENQQEVTQLLARHANSISQNVTQQFSQREQASASQLSALRKKLEQGNRLEESNRTALVQLQQKIASLGQNQPSDWLLQEAEYLIRMAARTLWLEKETRTAISLLNDADMRIQELNDPQFLVLRQTIQQDIAKLQQLPKLATDDVIVKLMVLDQQIKQLPMALFEIPEINQTPSSLELTDKATDWRENLAKTWRKFIDEFFTVTRRTGNIEPLMSPQFQQNLRENLSLKIQTAIWAASKSKGDIYHQSLSATERWINEYFDMTKLENQSFLSTVDALKSATVEAVYPNNLEALKVIRQLLSDKQRSLAPTLQQERNNDSPQESVAKPENAEQSEEL